MEYQNLACPPNAYKMSRIAGSLVMGTNVFQEYIIDFCIVFNMFKLHSSTQKHNIINPHPIKY
jgi:hypothetical protein